MLARYGRRASRDPTRAGLWTRSLPPASPCAEPADAVESDAHAGGRGSEQMSDRARRVWRAAPGTLTAVVVFTLLAAGAVLGLAYLIYQRAGSPWIPGALALLALIALFYAWRFGLHPRLVADAKGVAVRNPFSRATFDWNDITVIAPGENGLVVGSADAVIEAVCVQKSNWSPRRGRFTRADAIAHALLDLVERHDPPLEDEETGLRIRRARPDESRTLTRI